MALVVVVLDHRHTGVAAQVRDLQRASYRAEAELIGFDQMPPDRFEVSTGAENGPAIALYRAMGYQASRSLACATSPGRVEPAQVRIPKS